MDITLELSALLGGSGATDLKNAWAFFYAPQGITSICGEKSLQHTSDDMLMSMFAQKVGKMYQAHQTLQFLPIVYYLPSVLIRDGFYPQDKKV